MMTMEKMKRKRDHDEEKEEARTMWVLKADDDPPWEIRPSSARPNALSQISSVRYSHIEEDREKTFHKSKKSQRDRDKKQRLERILYKWFLEEDKPAGKSGT